MKVNFRIIGKFALLLVIIGFLMPVACDMNGFELADFMIKENDQVFQGLLLYLLFVSAIAGLVPVVFLLMKKNISPIVDWAVIAVCVVSGIIPYLGLLKEGIDLQRGAYVILSGWIAALALQIISLIKKEA